MRFRSPNQPTDKEGTDDAYAEFPAEPTTRGAAPQQHDWFAEFPDEKTTPPVVRSKTWKRLSESVTDKTD